MRKRLTSVVALCSVLAPSAASAGFVLGGRLGVGLPGGEVDGSGELAEVVDLAVPLQLDVGYRFTTIAVGAYLRLGPGKLDPLLASDCDAVGASCRTYDVAFGAQLDVRLSDGNARPWLGGYVGAETLRYDVRSGGSTAALDARGWELGAQGGIDFAWGAMTLGPYAAIGVGRFTTGTLLIGGTKIAGDIAEKRTHTWIHAGIRAGFGF